MTEKPSTKWDKLGEFSPESKGAHWKHILVSSLHFISWGRAVYWDTGNVIQIDII